MNSMYVVFLVVVNLNSDFGYNELVGTIPPSIANARALFLFSALFYRISQSQVFSA